MLAERAVIVGALQFGHLRREFALHLIADVFFHFDEIRRRIDKASASALAIVASERRSRLSWRDISTGTFAALHPGVFAFGNAITVFFSDVRCKLFNGFARCILLCFFRAIG